MFGRIGRFTATHARAVLVVTVLVMLGAGALGFTAFGKLETDGGFEDPAAESSQAQELINAQFGGENDVVFLMTANEGTVDDPAVRTAADALTERLLADGTVVDLTSYFTTDAPPMRSADGKHAIAVAKLTDDGDVEDLRDAYDTTSGPLAVSIGGPDAVGTDIGDQVGSDLALAESIAVPIILVLLVVVFGSVIAALLPLAIGAIAVLGTFALLSILGSMTDVSVFAINLTTALGLGLAIDYALLMVSRFREELAAGRDTPDAIVRTVETAGRTIMFSALTVAVALSALLMFPLYFLRSFAYAGVGVVIIAMLSAILVLPALLAVLGPKVNSLRLPWVKKTPSSVSAMWAKIARVAMRRPVLAGAPVVILLVIAAIPLLRVEFGTPDDRVLTTASETRVVGDVLRANFPTDDSKAVQLVTREPASGAQVSDYAMTLSRVPGVESVTTSAGTFADGRAVGGVDPSMAADSGVQRLTLLTDHDAHSAAGQDLVGEVRAVPTGGMDVLVGGAAARLVDSKSAIGDRLPLAAGLIAISTFLLLFLFTGSVLQPLRALLFNVLGLSATLGAMVMIFQEGWLSSWLGFTPLPLDTSMLVLLFCIVFGLSMDYEVFVMSRIKEMHSLGHSSTDAVTHGLSRTGRLITMAAVLLAVSLLAFGTSGVSFIQMFGIGSGLAILIDATLIRGVLVPVGMRVLGRAAWWAPRWLRRVHGRVGLSEGPSEPPTEHARVLAKV
ncbi:MAG: MMPL family transporter [Actinophytocola sp.]|uniref:MMPL family transporter n=1 Tax=Actinophytocola sp. TaxID=1872138 RepID=UPI001329C020|nr:MMPL family transporter [Actinophytocola sp.]MPZ79361.1 MMPL family transporter [Actinophytocola sp.]